MIYNYERNKDKKIPVRIRQEREISGLTQDLLAEKIGLSRQTLINYESGKSPVPIDVILKMCEVFGCEAEYLLCASDQRNRVNTDLCRATRLSEKAVENILDLNRGTKPLIGDLRTEELKTFENLICNPNFRFLLKSIANYKSKYLNFIKEKSIAKKNELKLSNYNYDEDISELKNKLDFALFQLQQDFVTLVNTSDED